MKVRHNPASAARERARRFIHCSRAWLEKDGPRALGAAYPSDRTYPLKAMMRKRSRIFRVGLWTTQRDESQSQGSSSVAPKEPRCIFAERGRTGFDSSLETQAACRGWFVGLVKNRAKTNKRRSPRSRSRGLIDRDVWSWTPATAPNVDSRLIGRRSDRAGR